MIIISGALFFTFVFAGGTMIAAVIFGCSKLLGLLAIIPGEDILTFGQAMGMLDVIFPALLIAGALVLICDKARIINIESLKPVEKAKTE